MFKEKLVPQKVRETTKYLAHRIAERKKEHVADVYERSITKEYKEVFGNRRDRTNKGKRRGLAKD